MRRVLVLLLTIGCGAEVPSAAIASEPPPPSCSGDAIEVGSREVTQLDDGSLWFVAGMAIDADGSPHAYHPEDRGLDYLANAGKPGNWWALVLDEQGEPIVQGADDPAPGYYVSTTSLIDSRYPVTDPRRYVDAETVPFVVLPPRLRKAGAKLGDLALVIDLDSGARSFAIFADVGPKTGLGRARSRWRARSACLQIRAAAASVTASRTWSGRAAATASRSRPARSTTAAPRSSSAGAARPGSRVAATEQRLSRAARRVFGLRSHERRAGAVACRRCLPWHAVKHRRSCSRPRSSSSRVRPRPNLHPSRERR